MANPEIVKQIIEEMSFHGHPRYLDLTKEELKLHSAKNKDYAGGGDPLGNFKRVANILKQYPGLDLSDPAIVAIIYAWKQIDAYLWMKCQGYEGRTEGKDARLQDAHIYFKIARILEEDK